jgi:isoleucyl-tRNA synthetase
MPYAQIHYPFENKEKFEKGFPAEFIAEGVDQTRAWFYYLHVISTAIKNSRAYNNVIVNGIVLAEDGKKMSKRLKNYPDPDEIMEKYGADALRFYLLSSPVMAAENLNFKESEVTELVRGMFRMLWNSYSFFVLYANIDKFNPATSYLPRRQAGKLKAKSLLDKWIISELNMLIKNVNECMENYELNRAVRFFPKFLNNLSNWYIRRSRRRFWKSENDEDKNQAYQTLYAVLVELSKLMAPFTPFVAEEIYRNLTRCHSGLDPESNEMLKQVQHDKECLSVHLADYPTSINELIDVKLNAEMEKVREIISEGLQERAKNGIKVRQPLNKFSIFNFQFAKELLDIIKEELNVKEIITDRKSKQDYFLDTKITEDLKLEGIAREIVRHIQEMRKEAGSEVDTHIKVSYNGQSEVFKKFSDLIAREVLADELTAKAIKDADLEKEFKIEGEKVIIQIKK